MKNLTAKDILKIDLLLDTLNEIFHDEEQKLDQISRKGALGIERYCINSYSSMMEPDSPMYASIQSAVKI